MLCHAYPACLPVATPRCKQYGSSPAEVQSEISCKVSERLQRLPKRLLLSEMMEVLLPGETRLEVKYETKLAAYFLAVCVPQKSQVLAAPCNILEL